MQIVSSEAEEYNATLTTDKETESSKVKLEEIFIKLSHCLNGCCCASIGPTISREARNGVEIVGYIHPTTDFSTWKSIVCLLQSSSQAQDS